MTPTPRTDAAKHEGLLRGNPIPTLVTTAEFAAKLETELAYENCIALTWQKAAEAHLKDKDQLRADIAELNERLIDRQETLMTAIVALREAAQLLTRCRNAAGRVEMDLYEDVQNFLHTHPSYRF